MDYILEGLQTGIAQMSWLEAAGVIFGLLSVWYAKQENILVFPTGIISVLIYVYICANAKLYADMGINAYYFVMSVYGWYVWTRKDDRSKHIPISYNSTTENIISIALLVVSFAFLRYVLINFTDSDVPNWDSTTTAIFFVGMWLMAKKKIENWIAWIVADTISIPLYFYKGLLLTSFQYFIFLILAIMGLIAWHKDYKARQS